MPINVSPRGILAVRDLAVRASGAAQHNIAVLKNYGTSAGIWFENQLRYLGVQNIGATLQNHFAQFSAALSLLSSNSNLKLPFGFGGPQWAFETGRGSLGGLRWEPKNDHVKFMKGAGDDQGGHRVMEQQELDQTLYGYLVSTLSVRRQGDIPFADLLDNFNGFAATKLTDKDLKASLARLQQALLVEVSDGSVKLFDQVGRLAKFNEALRLDRELQYPRSLHGITQRVEALARDIIGSNLNLYFVDEAQAKLVARSTGSIAGSTYEVWKELQDRATGIVNSAEKQINGAGEEVDKLILVNEHQPSDKDRAYFDVYGDPAQPEQDDYLSFVIRHSVRSGDASTVKLFGFGTYHNWSLKENGLPRRPLYVPGANRELVQGALDTAGKIIGESISKVLNLPQNAGKSIKQIWEKEESPPPRSRYLTEEGLFNHEIPLPQTAAEWNEIMSRVLVDGVFPGDTKPVSLEGWLVKNPILSHANSVLRRKGEKIYAQTLTPKDCEGMENFLAFLFDIICQSSDKEYRNSYDKNEHYLGRTIRMPKGAKGNTLVLLSNKEGLPIGYASLSRYETEAPYRGKKIEYVLIQSGYIHHAYHGFHLISYTLKSNTFRAFLDNWRDRKGPQLVLAFHTGKPKVIELMYRATDQIDDPEVIKVLRSDVFNRITPDAEMEKRKLNPDTGKVEGTYASGKGAFPRDKGGNLIIPESAAFDPQQSVLTNDDLLAGNSYIDARKITFATLKKYWSIEDIFTRRLSWIPGAINLFGNIGRNTFFWFLELLRAKFVR